MSGFDSTRYLRRSVRDYYVCIYYYIDIQVFVGHTTIKIPVVIISLPNLVIVCDAVDIDLVQYNIRLYTYIFIYAKYRKKSSKLVLRGLSTCCAEMWNECKDIFKFIFNSFSLALSLSLLYTIFAHVIVIFEQTFWEILEFMGGLSGKAV